MKNIYSLLKSLLALWLVPIVAAIIVIMELLTFKKAASVLIDFYEWLIKND